MVKLLSQFVECRILWIQYFTLFWGRSSRKCHPREKWTSGAREVGVQKGCLGGINGGGNHAAMLNISFSMEGLRG